MERGRDIHVLPKLKYNVRIAFLFRNIFGWKMQSSFLMWAVSVREKHQMGMGQPVFLMNS